MGYEVFALKYRPSRFDEVIGQEQVVRALRNAIEKGRLHHAYLFSGPRGVGKTSLARIFARALNCSGSSTPTADPCGKCASCRAIARGNSLDVIEIDGASNRGIDEIRALRESAKLSPAFSRFKIYIIDEVHMLTQEAFNALLKTLEEPPSHVKFIFATTHPHKVIPTILSRCQKYQFTLLSVEKIARKLEAIVRKERLTVNTGLIRAISRSAAGSIRDAESLLDQIAPIASQKSGCLDVMSFLGIIDEESLSIFTEHLFNKDAEAALTFIQKVVDDGKDLSIFLQSVTEEVRCILIASVSPKAFSLIESVSPEAKKKMYSLAKKHTPQDIIRTIDLLIAAKGISRELHSVRIPFELAVVKNCLPVLKTPALSSKKPVPAKHPPKKEPRQKPAEADAIDGEFEDGEFDFDFEDDAPAPVKEPKKKDTNRQDSLDVSLTLKEAEAAWPRVIAEIAKARASLAAYLSEAVLSSCDKGVLTVAFPVKCSFHKETVESFKNIQFIQKKFAAVAGKRAGIRCVLVKEAVSPAGADASKKKKEVQQEENDFINQLLDTFDGNLHTDID